ncbi:transposase [Enhygromyxa salina]|uniref:transposase n=1 Tax=Enhygromyxa salina TaxID=215803 RepID=UPI003B8A7486
MHVGPAIDGRERKRLERLCRYMARPPVCQERLAVTGSGQVVVRFKNVWRNGAHAVVLDPLDFIARLVALIPPPRFNTIRYHGVLAARAKARNEVVPGPAPTQPEPVQLRLAFDGDAIPPAGVETTPAPGAPACKKEPTVQPDEAVTGDGDVEPEEAPPGLRVHASGALHRHEKTGLSAPTQRWRPRRSHSSETVSWAVASRLDASPLRSVYFARASQEDHEDVASRRDARTRQGDGRFWAPSLEPRRGVI